ncbi:MAG: MgtC/SapB family protein [Armatimonadota bacterium]|nr:MgtC/SapB family protein [Armatimonadota bacterium]
MIDTFEIGLRLLLAIILGGIVGIEREVLEKPAGFRTHILVTLGAATFTLVSRYGFFGSGADPARIASNIVVGIGFIGAGTIWRHGAGVGGLTTAASLWTVAAIGMAAGAGFYAGALLATALVVVVLHLFARVERRLPRRVEGAGILTMTTVDRPGQLGRIGSILGRYQASIEGVEMTERLDGRVNLQLAVRLPKAADREKVLLAVAEAEGVDQAAWER